MQCSSGSDTGNRIGHAHQWTVQGRSDAPNGVVTYKMDLKMNKNIYKKIKIED